MEKTEGSISNMLSANGPLWGSIAVMQKLTSLSNVYGRDSITFKDVLYDTISYLITATK